MKNCFKIGCESLTVSMIRDIITRDYTISLSSDVKKKIKNCNKYLIDKISNYSDIC